MQNGKLSKKASKKKNKILQQYLDTKDTRNGLQKCKKDRLSTLWALNWKTPGRLMCKRENEGKPEVESKKPPAN